MEENDFTCNKPLGVTYLLLHCSRQVAPGPLTGFVVAAGTRFGDSLLGHSTVCDAAPRPVRAPGSHRVYVSMRDQQIPCLDQQQISSQGRVAFKRRLRQDAQCFKTDDEHSTRSGKFFPCVLTQERTPSLPVLLASTACTRQFGDETFLGEWMSWQMLSAGHLLKSQLVRGYRSCSVEHSWFT